MSTFRKIPIDTNVTSHYLDCFVCSKLILCYLFTFFQKRPTRVKKILETVIKVEAFI